MRILIKGVPEFLVEFTDEQIDEQIDVLMACSKAHYDGVCKDAGRRVVEGNTLIHEGFVATWARLRDNENKWDLYT